MVSLYTEAIEIRLTSYERKLIEGLADMRGIAASDLLREWTGLGREEELQPASRPLRLVTSSRPLSA
jgi:hypothetical protein